MKPPKHKHYPTFIQVRDEPYRIVIQKHVRKGGVGLCDDTSKTLYSSKRQTRYEAFATFFHEWLHAVEKEYGIKLGHPLIEILEYAMADLILENCEFRFKQKRRLRVKPRAGSSKRKPSRR